MNHRMINRKTIAAAILLLASLSGCAGPTEYSRQHFILKAEPQKENSPASNNLILKVERFTVNSAFDSKALVYKISQYEYQEDFYNSFLITPTSMITESARNWLTNSGLFYRVLGKTGRSLQTHTLRGNITKLYSDFSNQASPKAVVEIRIYMLSEEDDSQKVLLAKKYYSETPIENKTSEAIIEAMSISLTNIFQLMEADINKTLNPPQKKGSQADKSVILS